MGFKPNKFESLVATFREYKDYEGPCFVRYDDLGDLDENKIELTYLVVEDILVMKLIAEDGRTYATERIEGLQPCVVAGREEMAHEGREVVAENFYYNWIEPGVNRRERRPDFYYADRVVLLDEEEIIWDGEESGREDGQLLYLAMKGKICFIPTYSDVGLSLGIISYKCNTGTEKGIDEDCLDSEEEVARLKRFSCGQS